ncbi:MAG TPA: helix-turn-helix domain-containing protein, partial [Capillimicrobium sp.]
MFPTPLHRSQETTMAQRHDTERDGAVRMTKVATALKHPTRQKALEILNQRDASPSDIARRIDQPIANVTYHMKILRRLGLIEQIDERHVRGAVEHIYRAIAAPILLTSDWEGVPATSRHQI